MPEALLFDLRCANVEAPRRLSVRGAGRERCPIDAVMGLVELLDLAARECVHGINKGRGVEERTRFGLNIEPCLVCSETTRASVEDDVPLRYDFTGSTVPVSHVTANVDVLINNLDIAFSVPAIRCATLSFSEEDHSFLFVSSTYNP